MFIGTAKAEIKRNLRILWKDEAQQQCKNTHTTEYPHDTHNSPGPTPLPRAAGTLLFPGTTS